MPTGQLRAVSRRQPGQRPTRGRASRCQCQRHTLQPSEFFDSFPVEPRTAYSGLLTGVV